MLLEGKKAIITGGTRGIGYAIACRFIEEGAAVTVFGSRQETADAAVEKLTAAYPDAKVWGRSCDLTSLEAVTEAFTQAAADMGGLDTVVNNAGISQRSPLMDYTAEEFAKVMDLNVVAVFNGHQAAAKIMTEAGHGGTITTTSSMVAKYGQPSGVGYPTSKFAVNGMVQSLSRELAPMGIRAWASPRMSPMPLSSWQATCPPTSRAPSSPSTEPPAPKGRKPRLRTSTRPNAKGALSASTAGSAPCSVCRGSRVPEFRLRPGRSFPQGHVSESVPRFERQFWDAVSRWGPMQKLHPVSGL